MPAAGWKPPLPAMFLRDLTDEEGVVVNAEIAAAIQEHLASADYGAVLGARGGVTTVALDENGEIVQYAPDGSSVPLDRGA